VPVVAPTRTTWGREADRDEPDLDFAASSHADERTRTSTELPPHGPEPCASTNSATSAGRADDTNRALASVSRRLC
jgi:hypothetical protein